MSVTVTTMDIIRDAQKRADEMIASLSKDKSYEIMHQKIKEFIEHVEKEMRKFDIIPPAAPVKVPVVPSSDKKDSGWLWDAARNQYFYWSYEEGCYVYQSGLRVRESNGVGDTSAVDENDDDDDDETLFEDGDDNDYVVD
jgi:hypothetical protein